VEIGGRIDDISKHRGGLNTIPVSAAKGNWTAQKKQQLSAGAAHSLGITYPESRISSSLKKIGNNKRTQTKEEQRSIRKAEFMDLVINKIEYFVTMYAFKPADRRFKAPLIKLQQGDLEVLSIFLGKMLDKIKELRGSIPENKLFEDDTRIQGIVIHYMVRRNKIDILFYFPYRAGIAVPLQEKEIEVMLNSLSEIPNRVEQRKKAFI